MEYYMKKEDFGNRTCDNCYWGFIPPDSDICGTKVMGICLNWEKIKKFRSCVSCKNYRVDAFSYPCNLCRHKD